MNAIPAVQVSQHQLGVEGDSKTNAATKRKLREFVRATQGLYLSAKSNHPIGDVICSNLLWSAIEAHEAATGLNLRP